MCCGRGWGVGTRVSVRVRLGCAYLRIAAAEPRPPLEGTLTLAPTAWENSRKVLGTKTVWETSWKRLGTKIKHVMRSTYRRSTIMPELGPNGKRSI